MKENYAPWAIDINSFPEQGGLRDQLKFLLGFVLLAPSGHNSQPWSLKIIDKSVEFWVNKDRSLAKSDPERRQLSIAMGCALENLITAADFYGFSCDIVYFPLNEEKDFFVKASLARTGSTKNDSNHLIFSIPNRRTNRGKYEDKILSQEFIEKISKISNSETEVLLITDKEIKEQLAETVNKAQIESMDSDSFREELSHYVKSNFTKDKVGMPGFTLGLPAPISLIASKLIKKINMSRKSKKQDDALLKLHTPAFIIIGTREDNQIGWVKSGQAFERIWLIAESFGISCAPLASGVQVGDYHKQVREVAGVTSTPRVFARVGYSKMIPRHSPRLAVRDILI
ncbi:MAG: hypothetical protein G01um101420_634 [Parcubacteria group bacterium Gr01-1014_20]|nr:MAG: hypothetical protein G01um101420_634 [Parcubacteria group bacterium Gr01-1014_20]